MSESKRRVVTAVATIRLPTNPRVRIWLLGEAVAIAAATGGTVVLRSQASGERGLMFLTVKQKPRLETTTERPRAWMSEAAHHLGVERDDVTVVGHVKGQEALF